jgi:hypothetical protein
MGLMISAILIFSIVFITAVGGTLYIANFLEKEED